MHPAVDRAWAPRSWARNAFASRPLLTCVLAGAALGVFVIHATAAFVMDNGSVLAVGPTLRAAFSLASFPLLAYHALMGVIVGCGAGAITTRAYRAQLVERERGEALASQLQRAQRMEGIGRLAAGVAHDFNNVLTAIRMSVYLAKATAAKGADPTRYLDEAENSVQRGTHLPRQLLAFARRQPSEPKLVDVVALVRDLEKLMKRLLGEDVLLETDLAPSVVRVDPGQFEQVLVNLAVNARDAMPAGGKLRITNSVRRVDAGAIPAEDLAPGDYGVTSVTDTGTGIEPDVLARIFEPFFTTKPEGKGTGLGLATVYGIAHQNGGAVTVESTLGRGTTFHVYLPLQHSPAATTESGAVPPLSPSAGMRVLVVEDQDAVREAVSATLAQLGYHVTQASSPGEALVRAADLAHQGSFVLLADVVMPGMRGPELAARVRAAHPDARVLFMTGFADDETQRELDGEIVLSKPFSPQALTAKLRAAAS